MSSAVKTAPKSKKNKNKKKSSVKTKDAENNEKGSEAVQTVNEVDTAELEGEDDEIPVESSSAPVNGSVSTIPDRSVNGTAILNGAVNGSHSGQNGIASDAEERLESMGKDREALREEVVGLRKDLEELRAKHEKELLSVNEKLEEALNEKEQAETQYHSLLGKVGTIKSQLGERLKADADEIAQAKTQITELDERNQELAGNNTSLEMRIKQMRQEEEERSKELSTLRNRTNLSQQNWSNEREDLISREAFAREEFEAAKQAMQDWEVLAMEERSIRESLTERSADLEEQLLGQKQAFESASSERDAQSLAVDGLQRALQELQTARKQELRELVESNQNQVEILKKKLQEVEKTASESTASLETAQKELERTTPFEQEVRERNLQIGKLRHQCVTLNEHLTKALRFIKKGKPDDNVDRQIVTTYLMQFLAFDRTDPKKFEVLQLISALLNWTDSQREQAGLSRPGGGGSLRAPVSPFLRTPSSPALSSELLPDSHNKESLAELWSSFLEQEATSKSRSTSVSSSSKPPSAPKS